MVQMNNHKYKLFKILRNIAERQSKKIAIDLLIDVDSEVFNNVQYRENSQNLGMLSLAYLTLCKRLSNVCVVRDNMEIDHLVHGTISYILSQYLKREKGDEEKLYDIFMDLEIKNENDGNKPIYGRIVSSFIDKAGILPEEDGRFII